MSANNALIRLKSSKLTQILFRRLLGSILVTTFCDRLQFISLADKERPGRAKLLPASSPHLVTSEAGAGDLVYSAQDTASNNLMVVSRADLELSV